MLKNNLKTIRMKKSISQEKLAREVNISVRTIQNIEKNSSTDIETAIKIKRALECKDVEEIFILEK